MDNENPLLSVVVCTHNPKVPTLSRVLAALEEQTLPLAHWELILVDNASKTPLSSVMDIKWHVNGRHVVENELGLTPARLRGIQESAGDVIVFVDDDNILESDYLEEALKVGRDRPEVGAWGGNVEPEYEISPPDWVKPYVGLLAVREIQRDHWSTDAADYESQPCGAGLCVRRSVARRYRAEVLGNPLKMELDRKGDSLASCGDSDLAQTSLECGLGFGVFRSLRLVHIIPARRLDEDYLLNLAKSMAISMHMLTFLRTKRPLDSKVTLRSRMGHLYRLIRLSRREKKFYLAKRDARRIAVDRINEIQKSSSALS